MPVAAALSTRSTVMMSPSLKRSLTSKSELAGTCKLSKQDKELQIVWREVYVPNVLDSQSDWAGPEEVQNMAYGFLKSGNNNQIETRMPKNCLMRPQRCGNIQEKILWEIPVEILGGVHRQAMIKKLVFHIGDPKCGSSSIQQALQDRACKCDAVSIVPQNELNASKLAISLNQKQSNPRKYERNFAKRQQWVHENEGDLGILSAEFFSASKPRMLQRALQEKLVNHVDTARIIAYVRPHHSRLVASYAQRVKIGSVSSDFSSFVRLCSSEPKFTYTPRFLRWLHVLGDRFTLRPFIREEMQGQDVVADFFHTVLQGAPFTLTPVAQTNESLSLEELAGMRIVQSVLIEREVPHFVRLSLGGAIGGGLSATQGRSGNRLQLDRGSAAFVSPSFRKDAEALDAAFFPGGLMVRAFDEALAGAIETAQSLDPNSYFPATAQRDLRQLAGQLAELSVRKPHAWRDDYMRRIGQHGFANKLQWERKNEGNLGVISAKKRNAAAVWTILERLYPLLASGRQVG